MRPDAYASDLDYEAQMGQARPDSDLCPHGIDLMDAGCGACVMCREDDWKPLLCAHGYDMGHDCAECAVAAEMQLAAMFDKVLRRIQQHEDETKGVALAARFGG